MCQSLIGQQISDSVQRVETEPYTYVVIDTGEILTLTNRWQFVKEGEVLAAEVVAPEKVQLPV